MSKSNGNIRDVRDIYANDLCIGCGVCAGMQPDKLRMVVDRFGAYEPVLIAGAGGNDWAAESLAVCPFAEHDENEDTLAGRQWGSQTGHKHSSETGWYLDCLAGHVNDQACRMASSSGGIVTWLAKDLLASGAVGAVVCVGPSEADDGKLFGFRVVRDLSELGRCGKSRYYPVELSEMLPLIRQSDEKIALIGLPCFIKAIRLAMLRDEVLADRIGVLIGVVCGHLKTRFYAAYLGRCCGVNETGALTVDFRKKVPDRAASDYSFEVVTKRQGEEEAPSIRMRDVFAGSWSYNLFMLGACDCCDDVFAETADVVVGDAWLPKFVRDYRGESLVVCRRPDILERLKQGAARGEIGLQGLELQDVIKSQEGGLRHRRAGLSYRLYQSGKAGAWRPRKRVRPDRRALSVFYRLIQRLRLRTRRISLDAFAAQRESEGLSLFVSRMRPWIRLFRAAYLIRGLPGRIKAKFFGRARDGADKRAV